MDLSKPLFAHDDLMRRQRVEQLVRDEGPLERRGQRRVRRSQPLDIVTKRFLLCRARVGAGFDEMELNRIVEREVARARRAQDVGRQATVAGAGFDEVEGARTQYFAHLGELDFEELAEQRTDVDAGKKIARAARSLGGAGVVAELRVVK